MIENLSESDKNRLTDLIERWTDPSYATSSAPARELQAVLLPPLLAIRGLIKDTKVDPYSLLPRDPREDGVIEPIEFIPKEEGSELFPVQSSPGMVTEDDFFASQGYVLVAGDLIPLDQIKPEGLTESQISSINSDTDTSIADRTMRVVLPEFEAPVVLSNPGMLP